MWVGAMLAGTFLVGVVASVLLVLAWQSITDDDAAQTASTGSKSPITGPIDTGDAEPEASPPDHQAATRLSRCAEAVRTLDGPLGAARPSLDQWAVHVGAMNQLVVGEITLQQATDFWNRTRLGAQRRVAEFRDAVDALRRRGVDCPSPDLLAPGARALPGCARQVEAKVRTLRAATTSIDTWDRHVRHMDMMRLGELSPEVATRMWLSMWKEGVRDLDTYRSAAREARRLVGCTVVAEGE